MIDGEQRWQGIGAIRKAVLFVVHVYLEKSPNGEEVVRIISAREAIRVSAESIWNKPLSERQQAKLDGVASRQKRAAGPEIDYSDIPALTDRQLARFRRPQRNW